MQKTTEQLLDEFEKCIGLSAFACIKEPSERNLFIGHLHERIAKPHRINQLYTPLCGPAAFMYCIAKDRPHDYLRYVLDLVTTGTGKLGGLIVTPSAACRNAVIKGKIAPADWVALASLRDSSNKSMQMSSPDSNAAGITLPGELAEWFSKTGWFSGGVRNYAGLTSKSFEHLLDANQRPNSHVCLFIRSSIISHTSNDASAMGVRPNKISGKGTPKTWLGTPDHWVVLNSGMRINGLTAPAPNTSCYNEAIQKQPINFTMTTWGSDTYKASSRIDKITAAQFVPYYYGYVSATR